MGVSIDEAGSHHFARGINALAREALELPLWSNPGDTTVLDQNGMVRQYGMRFASGQHCAVLNEQ
jgi:hypothetical protein